MNSKKPASEGSLGNLADLLDRAVKKVPQAKYFWGVIAASATVAWITFVSIFAAFLAMLLIFVFSRFERSSDRVVRFVGHLMLLLTGATFAFVILSAMSLAVFCKPSLLSYLYGVSDYCERRIAAKADIEKPDNQKPSLATYRNFALHNGEWVGVDPVSSETAKHLNHYYEFMTGANPKHTLEVRAKNGSGGCPNDDALLGVTGDAFGGSCSGARACSVKLSYKLDGSVDKQEILDQAGHVLEGLQYPNTSVGQFIDAVYPCDHGRSGIRLVHFERSASGPSEGLNAVTTFLDKDGHPRPNDEGAYGYRSTYQANREVERIRLGPRGENWGTNANAATERTVYSDDGLPISTTYFDEDGRPTAIGRVAGTLKKYDEWGNWTETVFLDLAGKRVLRRSDWTASMKQKYDDQGNIIEHLYFGTLGELTLTNGGIAGWRARYDEKGNQISSRFIGIDGQSTLQKGGSAGWNARYDERGIETLWERIDINGIQTAAITGWAYKQTKVDDRLNIIEQRFLGRDRSPSIILPDGDATHRFTYDQTNKKLTAASFDRNDHPTIREDGSAAWRAKYDERGNEVELINMNADGMPVLLSDKTAGQRTEYDERGNVIAQVNLGLAGRPLISDALGYASVKLKFDEKGNEIERAYFDTDGRPMLNPKMGAASWKAQFDVQGNEIARSYFGLGGEPVLSSGGYSTIRYEFDETGNQIGLLYFGVDGNPSERDGIAGSRKEFDERGREIRVGFMGKDRRPALLTSNSAAGWVAKYDPRGQLIEYLYLGLDGKVCISKEGVAGWRSTYDQYGNETEHKFVDAEGRSVVGRSGYAGYTSQFDDKRHEVRRVYFAVDGAAIVNAEGIAAWSASYDERGNVVEQNFFDAAGNKTLGAGGYATVRYSYDQTGRETIHRLFDTQGKPVRSPISGRSVVRTTYDEHNLKVRESGFDELDRPVDRLDEKWTTQEWIYDANGKLERRILRNALSAEINN
jgi:hypothetical protein